MFEGEVIQGPVTASLHGHDVILCDRKTCLFCIPYEIDDGTEPDVCCRPQVEWDADKGCINFAEYSSTTELGQGQVLTEQEVDPWLTQTGRAETVHIHEGMMHFINKTPVPKEAFDKAVQSAIEFNAKLMAQDMENRGLMPEDVDGQWVHDYYQFGNEAILGDPDDIRLEKEGRRKLAESHSEKVEESGD